MNKGIAFILGAATGSLLTLFIVKDYYKKIADEEIEAVREHYRSKEEGKNNGPDDEIKPIGSGEYPWGHVEHKKVDPEYKQMVDELGYTEEEMEELVADPDTVIEHSDKGYEVFIEPGVEVIEPFVISPDEFGEYPHYETKSFSYYKDFVLTDDDGEIVTDPDSIIGDALSHFGEYEEDCVHVRNDNLECDYEILKVYKSFNELNEEDN